MACKEMEAASMASKAINHGRPPRRKMLASQPPPDENRNPRFAPPRRQPRPQTSRSGQNEPGETRHASDALRSGDACRRAQLSGSEVLPSHHHHVDRLEGKLLGGRSATNGDLRAGAFGHTSPFLGRAYAIKNLKIIVGIAEQDAEKRKRLVIKLLEKEALKWTEEKLGTILIIRLDKINPKRLSFAGKY